VEFDLGHKFSSRPTDVMCIARDLEIVFVDGLLGSGVRVRLTLRRS
jgi:hypothetical protein